MLSKRRPVPHRAGLALRVQKKETVRRVCALARTMQEQ
jgi:hypothetical protein